MIAPVANIVDQPQLNGKGKVECQGTIHFSPETKVYLVPYGSYDIAMGRARVTGMHRDGKVCELWMKLERLENWKVEEVEDNRIISSIKSFIGGRVREWHPKEAQDFCDWRNSTIVDWYEYIEKHKNEEV